LAETDFPRDTAELLNEEWEVDAVDCRFHKYGNWYHRLRWFPGAYFDPSGYISFSDKEAYEQCQGLDFGTRVHVQRDLGDIAKISGYKRGKWRATPHALARLDRKRINETEDEERRAWLRVRINHRKFAIPVKAGGECVLTGLKIAGLLDACHIRPWKDCNNDEKRNPLNGLCLATHIHKAFDLHLLGITPDGDVRYSERFYSEERHRLGLPDQMRIKVSRESGPHLKARYDKFLEQQVHES
jgi:HNH endonuclease